MSRTETGIDAAEKKGNGGKDFAQMPDTPSNTLVPVSHPRCYEDIVRLRKAAKALQEGLFIHPEAMIPPWNMGERGRFSNFRPFDADSAEGERLRRPFVNAVHQVDVVALLSQGVEDEEQPKGFRPEIEEGEVEGRRVYTKDRRPSKA
jgi:hypothetical protein